MICLKEIAFILIIGVELLNSKPISNDVNEDELIFAHVIYRHGNRTLAEDPDHIDGDDFNFIFTYKNDPYNNVSFWKEGIGALTKVGKDTQYRLGKFLRRRYNELIGPGYSFDKVYIRSTDKDRTLMSAAANCAGLFEPTENERWNEFIDWQPVPIHTIPQDDDCLLIQTCECGKFDEMRTEYLQSEDYQAALEKHSGLIEFLEEHSGTKFELPEDFFKLHDALNIESALGLPLPNWAEYVLETSNDILEYFRMLYYESFMCAEVMKKAKAGFLIKEMFDRFRNKTLSSLNPVNLWIYSAHDTTIYNVLNALNIRQTIVPPFAASLHLELFKNDLGYNVRLFYRTDNSEYIPPIEIPNCGIKCPLDKLFELYDEILPTEKETFESICRLSTQTQNSTE